MRVSVPNGHLNATTQTKSTKVAKNEAIILGYWNRWQIISAAKQRVKLLPTWRVPQRPRLTTWRSAMVRDSLGQSQVRADCSATAGRFGSRSDTKIKVQSFCRSRKALSACSTELIIIIKCCQKTVQQKWRWKNFSWVYETKLDNYWHCQTLNWVP